VLFFQLGDDGNDEVDLAFEDGGAVGKSGGCLGGVYHEGIGEAVAEHPQIGMYAAAPGVLHGDTVFGFEAHVADTVVVVSKISMEGVEEEGGARTSQ
jgi:hypothetical protein